MKELRKLVFAILHEITSDQPARVSSKNSNSLKEIKAVVNVCLTEMGEITGRPIGRWRSLAHEKVEKYEKIAYKLAHQYVQYLDVADKEEAFEELVSAGKEGIMHGLTSFNMNMSTKLSTFVFGRTKFAIQKQFNAMKRHVSKSCVSLNAKLDEEDEETDFQSMVMSNDNVEEVVEKKIQYEALNNALGSLPPHMREVVMLCANNSVSKVAKRVKMPIKEIYGLLSFMRKRIDDHRSSSL
jgi:RNA polymerase sigma factor (sigma-70 family)